MLNLFKNIFGDSSSREIARLKPIVEKINQLESKFEKFSDSEIINKTKELKDYIEKRRAELKISAKDFTKLNRAKRLRIQAKEQKILDEILPDAFAQVREAAKRAIGQRHYDVQMIGGIVLHQGKIAEMRTGEGKTLVATLPLYLNSLLGRGAHLITVNDFLAKAHTQWMGPIYNLLSVSVGCIQHEKSYLFELKSKTTEFGEEHNLKSCTRKEAYAADITYGTNNEFGFDYLRDNMVQDLAQMAQRDLVFAIVDEVDSILIDEARTPLIISAPAQKSADLYYRFARLVPNLEKEKDYTVDEKMQAVSLTPEGIKKVEKILNVGNLYGPESIEYIHYLEEALKANALFHKDKDYVIKDGEVVIVDQFTGRLMPGRRWSEGLHQAVEAKENVEIKRESVTLATISFQNLFRLYSKLAGMTGTAQTESEEFYKIYGLSVMIIPTHKPMIRIDQSDKIYKNEEGKYQAVIETIKEKNKKGQPVLIGTIAIEKSEVISQLLKREGIKHNVLNAKHHEKEAKIIAQAGKLGAVTVATNMAGRGVDIILSGNPPDKKEQKKIQELGGLFVIGTERHEARRIDNQLRGRAGRQGDPGASQFYISMDDDLMRVFGGDKIKSMMDVLRLPEDQPIENKMISRSIESAQKKVEGHNFDIRKHLVEYDDVMNKHREVIYEKRRNVFVKKSLRNSILFDLKNILLNIFAIYQNQESENKKQIETDIYSIIPKSYFPADFSERIENLNDPEQINHYFSNLLEEIYQKREQELSIDTIRQVEKALTLRAIDTLWVEHLTLMDELRQSIGLLGYGQRDPLIEYKRESYDMFSKLQNAISTQVCQMIFHIEVKQESKVLQTEKPKEVQMTGASEASAAGTFQDEKAVTESRENTNSMQQLQKSQTAIGQYSKNYQSGNVNFNNDKVGRNDPCPCGSGKKYKKCCGK